MTSQTTQSSNVSFLFIVLTQELIWYLFPELLCNMGNKHPLQWRHNEFDVISNHQPHDCLPNGLFRCRSKKASKLRVTGLCEGNSPVTGEFLAQRASHAENVSIWWRHHAKYPSYKHIYVDNKPLDPYINLNVSHSFIFALPSACREMINVQLHWLYLPWGKWGSNLTLQWRHNGRDGVSNHQLHEFLLNRLFRRRSKKTSKLRVTGLCEGNSPVTGEFPAQMASNAEKVPFDNVIMKVLSPNTSSGLSSWAFLLKKCLLWILIRQYWSS